MKKLIIILILFFNYSSFCQNLVATNDDSIVYTISSNIILQKVTTIKSLYFEKNKSVLNDNSINALKTIMLVMQDNPEMKILLNANSDLAETDTKLSLKRANAAKKFLIKSGVSSNRLKINNFGNTKQLSEFHAQQYDRRVEFEIE